ncbi:hypothetical protein AAFF_G00146940 [Aldrovandia affinis]|uniref:Uncharacterized protein n=1 Tax=Aldrovandia affinis TaxID=143900 RepID=A0AAD7W8P2_9TELE|nr:hypothetical protein AAFF_G00146940 [Aldrovandia affinis]
MTAPAPCGRASAARLVATVADLVPLARWPRLLECGSAANETEYLACHPSFAQTEKELSFGKELHLF